MSLAFYFDASACSGCKACQVACQDKHNLEAGREWRRVYEIEGGDWEKIDQAWLAGVYAFHLSIACNHCNRPICAEVCPSSAIERRADGLVLIDQERCLGCGYCRWACPYDALHFDKAAGVMSKCTFCVDELSLGRPPACVTACPLRVLDYGQPDALATKYGSPDPTINYPSSGNELSDGNLLPDIALTEPMLMVRQHKDQKRSGEPATQVRPKFTLDLEERPLTIFTLLLQAAAGLMMVLTILVTAAAVERGADQTALGWLDELLVVPVVRILIAVILGLSFSLLHLKRRRRAWRAVWHWRSSWLSREILAGLVFGLFLLALSLWVLIRSPSATANGSGYLYTTLAFTWLTAASGLVCVICMAQVYRLRTVPSWQTRDTLWGFLATTLLLGLALTGSGLIISVLAGVEIGPFSDLELSQAANWLVAGLILFLVVQTALARRRLADLSTVEDKDGAAYLGWRVETRRRLILLLIGVAIMSLLLVRPGGDQAAAARVMNGIAAVTALGFVAAAEVIDRNQFYKSYRRIGL